MKIAVNCTIRRRATSWKCCSARKVDDYEGYDDREEGCHNEKDLLGAGHSEKNGPLPEPFVLFYFIHNCLERSRVVHRKVGKNLTVQINACLLELTHKY